jgi:hypothetical protein
MDWQPIETAPESGDFLLWNGKRVAQGSRAMDDGEFWWADQDGYDFKPIEPEPTHWMPLPSPPE